MNAIEWLEKAKKEKFAIGAFNVGNLETFKAVVAAAVNKRSPVIIESSSKETKWMGAANVVDIAKNYAEEFDIPILINLDHSTTYEDCIVGIEAGYEMIHVDGSKLEFEENVKLTKRVTNLVHQRDLIAEGELDHIGGSSEVHQGSAVVEAAKGVMTDPKRAAEFVAETGVDIFAAFIGNVHGMYLGSPKNLDIDRLKQIAASTGAFLSLHGSSGIPEDQIKQAIASGIVKINLNTELRRAFKDNLNRVLKEQPDEYALYNLEPDVLAAVQQIVEHKIELFGSAGKA